MIEMRFRVETNCSPTGAHVHTGRNTVTFGDLLWWLALLAGLVTAAMFLYVGHAQAELIGQVGAIVVGIACIWSFLEPRRY